MQKQAARVGSQSTSQQVNEGGFTRTVFTNERVNFARVKGHRYISECSRARKGFARAAHFQQRVRLGHQANERW